MSPLGLRGRSQLSCRESGLRAVNTSGPGALGVLRVKVEPGGQQRGEVLNRRYAVNALGTSQGEGRWLTWQGAERVLWVHL